MSHTGCKCAVTPLLTGSMFVPHPFTKRRKQDPTHFYSSGAGRRTPSTRVPLVRSLWKRQKDVRLTVPPRTILLPHGEGWEHFSQAAPLTGESKEGRQRHSVGNQSKTPVSITCALSFLSPFLLPSPTAHQTSAP